MGLIEEHLAAIEQLPESERNKRPEYYYQVAFDLRHEWDEQPEQHLPSQGQSYNEVAMGESELQQHQAKKHNKRRAAWVSEAIECADEINTRFISDPELKRSIEERVVALHQRATAENEHQHISAEVVQGGNELLDYVISLIEPGPSRIKGEAE